LEQEDCYSIGDDDEDDDLDGFIVNDDEEPEQAEESFNGKCLPWNSGDGRIRDTAQRLIFVASFFTFQQMIRRSMKTRSSVLTIPMMTNKKTKKYYSTTKAVAPKQKTKTTMTMMMNKR
jgi:hypothetical protein